MSPLQLAAILRVNAVDPDKELPLAECVKRFKAAPMGAQETWHRKAWKYLLEAAQPPGLTCKYYDHTGECCGKPALMVTFRRKADGFTENDTRCDAHRASANDRWEALG